MEEQQRPGEELFDKLNREKKQRRRKVMRTVIIVIAVIAAALVLLVLNLRRRVEQKFAAAEKEVLTYEVKPGTIHTLVTGSGVLRWTRRKSKSPPGWRSTRCSRRRGIW